MTSDRKTISNRNNGSKGRGPQTAGGKARSSQNAFRHGLSVSVLKEPAMCAEVEKLARALAGPGCDDFHLGQARESLPRRRSILFALRTPKSGS